MKRRENSEVAPEAVNPDWSLLRNARFCKSIAPNNSKVSGGEGHNELWPRIVKSDFKVPANWHVVEEVKEGQEMGEVYGHQAYHTCKRPFHETVRGFWVRFPQHQDIHVRRVSPID